MIYSRTLRLVKALAFAIAWGFLSLDASATKVTLAWDPSPDSTVVGYKVYTERFGIGTLNIVDVGGTNSATLDLAAGSTFLIYTTAYTGEGVESEPSNQVVYTVPLTATAGYSLQFGGFANGSAKYSPRGAIGPLGEMYPYGTKVTLTATAEGGYACVGWIVDSMMVNGNPAAVTMNRHHVVTPVIRRIDVWIAEQAPTEISLRIGTAGDRGHPVISIGGELGAWVLEGSDSLTEWLQVAVGLTSEQLPISAAGERAFYRVRPVSLARLAGWTVSEF